MGRGKVFPLGLSKVKSWPFHDQALKRGQVRMDLIKMVTNKVKGPGSVFNQGLLQEIIENFFGIAMYRRQFSRFFADSSFSRPFSPVPLQKCPLLSSGGAKVGLLWPGRRSIDPMGRQAGSGRPGEHAWREMGMLIEKTLKHPSFSRGLKVQVE